MTKADVIIIGAGAAGLMCAVTAGRRGLSVAVIEHSEKPGKKILISGGGRCNFTNIGTESENFISSNPHFCKSALANYTPQDFINLVSDHGIEFYEKKLGQLFCRKSSKQIVDMLMNECVKANVKVHCGTRVTSIANDNRFRVDTSEGIFECASLVIATGGISIPKMGATGFGYDIGRQFGHKILNVAPGLVPLILRDDQRKRFCKLSGISANVIATAGKKFFEENILFTHKGLSGPAVLQASSYWRYPGYVTIDFLKDASLSQILQPQRSSNTRLSQIMFEVFPQRLAETLIPDEILSKRISEISNKTIEELNAGLREYKFYPVDTEGFDKAEVTCGGIDTDGLSSKTMESRLVSGLYFIGEVVDVTGWLGGYNFQWAWASGFAAGMSVRPYSAY